VLDRNNVTFVSVTQSFNTTTSMGRLTLNILLSFAQFEREVIGERIRDKFAASRKRGMWMGGFVPMGYDVKDRKLVINEAEAATVRMIFERYVALGSATKLAHALQTEGVTNKRGRQIDKGFIYKLINNRVYIGEAVHKGTGYPGEHQAIISRDLWEKVHAMLQVSPRERASRISDRPGALLKGLIFSTAGVAMTPTYTRKGDRLYHYYVSMDLIQNRRQEEGAGPARLPAAMVEGVVIAEMRRMIATPEVAARVVQTFKQEGANMDEKSIIEALTRFDELWAALFPAEQARLTRLLVNRVTVGSAGIAVDLRQQGVGHLVRDLTAAKPEEVAA
jgi:hypothetical protein